MLSDSQRYVITFIEQQYALNGVVPSAEYIAEQFTDVSLTGLYNSAEFCAALERRGIPNPKPPKTIQGPVGVLTAQQLLVANTMLDFRDTRSNKNKLKDLECDTQTYQTWLKDPAFSNYIQTRAEQLLGESGHEVNLALIQRAGTGDTNAMRLYYGITGRYSERPDNSAIDVALVLIKVLEVIQRHISDAETLEAIAGDLSNLGGSNNSPVPTPTPMTTEFKQFDPARTIDVPRVIESA